MCRCRQPNKKIMRNEKIFENATHKLAKELDLINVLKTLRQAKLVQSTVFNTRQKMLMLYQDRDVIKEEEERTSQT